MNEYDFSRLNDKEFEVFCTDLLSAREGVRFERFKSGRDGGVDGRYFKPNGNEWILQCKHWVSTPLERLVKYVGESESPKVRKLAPERYFLAVSHSLSRNDKKNLMEVLAPFVLSSNDILGREDLNDLLAQHPEVEGRHYKLWLASANILRYLFDKPIMDRSDFAFEEILENSKIYVPTVNHGAAIAKLEAMGVVIITGPAGIGKTTLAEQLILHYVCDGFSLACISNDIREAENILTLETKQIFYFDDFLGRNYLEALSGHEGAQIVQFMKRIVKDKTKRFILTSRTTILNQGKILNDVFENSNIDRTEFEITLQSLTGIDKARILYNHIWHSSLDQELIEQLYEHKRYRKIIDHANFNPRLIRFITDEQRLDGVTAEKYWGYIQGLLNNPTKVWENPFEAQLDDCGRALVFLVALNGRFISQEDLAEAFARYICAPGIGSLTGKKDFLLNIRHLAGSMLTRFLIGGTEPYLRLFNPSLGDFVLHRYSGNVPALRACFDSLLTISSLSTIKNMTDNKFITLEVAAEIAGYIFERIRGMRFVGVQAEYVARLCTARVDFGLPFSVADPGLLDAIEFVSSSECNSSFLASATLILWAIENNVSNLEQVESFVEEACASNPSNDELIQLGQIVECLRRSGNNALTESYDEVVSEYLISEINDEFPDEQVFHECSSTGQAHANFKDFINERANELGVSDVSGLVESIVGSFNIDRKVDDFFYGGDHDHEYENYSRNERTAVWPDRSVDEIDDLFSRN
ncbi:restriction endonuclease [Pseudomonas sp. B21-054]|uniref:nSTAND3 domain-containing NTPase n=1 Tax=Pseudomonas sp. B21-054 TaxID=2895494 RepID=UPI0022321C1B|nr:restriction endonuclease [Pseudomonas sp. B21-054]UZE17089.1 restriction endonuclease [Pseudomonas sp. B21-054]